MFRAKDLMVIPCYSRSHRLQERIQGMGGIFEGSALIIYLSFMHESCRMWEKLLVYFKVSFFAVR